MADLSGSRVVVIGGSSGIGYATACRVLELGASVVIAARNQERLDRARASLEAAGSAPGAVEARPLDIADADGVRRFFAEVGEFDHLTTPGGLPDSAPFLDFDLDRARACFDRVFWGQWHAAQHGAPLIREGGSIVFVSGSWAQRPDPGAAAAASANSAVEGLTRALAVELAPIRVNAVSPGTLDTPVWSELGVSDTEKRAMFDALAEGLPLKRVGTADDIAETIVHLMRNPFTTGSTLFVDGGATLR
jgi:NAD(P)-dependent dehydrogenase (short-subunit alcohol dehydrogenase family)